jgi:sugar lactone lactonase YvrE
MRPFSSILAAALVSIAPGSPQAHENAQFPSVIQLPLGFRPEGIINDGHKLFVANFDHGAVYEVDARTGNGHILVPARPDRMGLGIKLDERTDFLWVAGGSTGHAYVYDEHTGAALADYVLAASGPTFINDLIIAGNAIYFTDSFRPSLFKITLGHGGRLPPQSAVQEIPITGDYDFVPLGPGVFNNNGIVRTPDCKALIVINAANGNLYRITGEGVSDRIDVAGGAQFLAGDGLVLDGNTLYVVQNTNNIAVVELKRRNRARVVDNITNPNFDTLATATKVGDALYVNNARFQVSDPTGQPFSVVRVPID